MGEEHRGGEEVLLSFQSVHVPEPHETCSCSRAAAAGGHGLHTPPAGGSCSVETARWVRGSSRGVLPSRLLCDIGSAVADRYLNVEAGRPGAARGWDWHAETAAGSGWGCWRAVGAAEVHDGSRTGGQLHIAPGA